MCIQSQTSSLLTEIIKITDTLTCLKLWQTLHLLDFSKTTTRLLHHRRASRGEDVHPNPFLFLSENENRVQQSEPVLLEPVEEAIINNDTRDLGAHGRREAFSGCL